MRNQPNPWNLLESAPNFRSSAHGVCWSPLRPEGGFAARVASAQSSRWTFRVQGDVHCQLADLVDDDHRGPDSRNLVQPRSGVSSPFKTNVENIATSLASKKLRGTPSGAKPKLPSDRLLRCHRSASSSSNPPFPLEIARNRRFLAGQYTNSYWSCLRNWLELAAILFIALATQAETKPPGQGKPEFFVVQGTLRQILAPELPKISEKKRTGRFDFLLEKKGGWTLLAQTDDDNYRRIYTLDRTNLLTAVFDPNAAAAALATREPANFLPNTDLTFGGLIITALTGRLGDSEHTTSPLWISRPEDRLSGPKYTVRPWLANKWAPGTKQYQIFEPESTAMPVAIVTTEAWSRPYGFDYPARVLMARMSESNLLFQVEIAVTNVFTAPERPKVFEPSIGSIFHFTDYAQAISSHAPTAHMRRATNWFYEVDPHLRLGGEAMPWYSQEVQESRIGRAWRRCGVWFGIPGALGASDPETL